MPSTRYVWLAGWLAGWLLGLVGWLVSGLVCWFVCFLACLFVCLLLACLHAPAPFLRSLRACTKCWPCQRTPACRTAGPANTGIACTLRGGRPGSFVLVFASTHEMLALPTNRATPLSELLSTCSLPCAMQNHVRSPRQEVVSKYCCRDPLRETTGPASGKSKPSMTVLPLRA